MAASLIGWIWAQSMERDLSTGARLTLFALNEHTSIGTHGDWRVFPGQSRLAKMVGCSEFTLRKHLKELTEAGLLTVANQFDKTGRQQANLYWLQAPKLVDEEGERNLRPPERNVPHGGQETCDKPFNKNPLNKRFIAPTVSEVAAYCSERNNGINAQKFIDHYEANGWMRGKNKIKCWKACVRTWESRDAESKPKSQWRGGI